MPFFFVLRSSTHFPLPRVEARQHVDHERRGVCAEVVDERVLHLSHSRATWGPHRLHHSFRTGPSS